MLKKSCAILMSALMLGVAAPLPVLAADTPIPVKTVTRSEHKVEVECPQVVGGNSRATEKINGALSRQVASYVSEASTLGGGKVHYDVHKADDNVISLTLVMTPRTGVEETVGMTFDRKTGAQKPLSSYYNSTELAQRSENGLRYLYDVDEAKLKTLPDTYYVDRDGSIIGLYHAGAVLDKAEGEIEINLSAADVEDNSEIYSYMDEEDNTMAKGSTDTDSDAEQDAKAAAEKAAREKEKEQANIKAMRERAKKDAEEKAAWEKKQADAKAAEEAAARKAAAEQAAKEKAQQEKAAKEAAEKAASQPKETMKERVAEYEAREKARQEEEAKRIAAEKAAQEKAAEEARKAAEAKAAQEQAEREAAEAERKAREAAQAAEANQWVTGTITGTEVRMRNSAGLDTDVVGYFEKGESVKVLDSDVASGRKWYRVQRSDGSRGWVAADYCHVGSGETSTGEARTGTIIGTDVRVRGSASLSGDILDYYQNGESVTILDEVNADGIHWFKVSRSNGETGWVAAQYCNVE